MSRSKCVIDVNMSPVVKVGVLMNFMPTPRTERARVGVFCPLLGCGMQFWRCYSSQFLG